MLRPWRWSFATCHCDSWTHRRPRTTGFTWVRLAGRGRRVLGDYNLPLRRRGGERSGNGGEALPGGQLDGESAGLRAFNAKPMARPSEAGQPVHAFVCICMSPSKLCDMRLHGTGFLSGQLADVISVVAGASIANFTKLLPDLRAGRFSHHEYQNLTARGKDQYPKSSQLIETISIG